MELQNFSIEEFLGIIIFFIIQVWLVLIMFDGLGKIKDFFYHSFRNRK
jgi:hypothetical protein